MTRTVAEKLGFRTGMRARLRGAPEAPPLGLEDSAEGPYDLLLAFVRSAAEVEAAAAEAGPLYRDGARLWFAYPKKSGAVRSDINRDHGWQPLAERDFLPVTQIAIDETWSALRFRRRHEIAKLTRKF